MFKKLALKIKLKWWYYIKPQFVYMVGQHVTVRPMCASTRHNNKLREWFDAHRIVPVEMDFPKIRYLLYTTEQINSFKKEFGHYIIKD